MKVIFVAGIHAVGKTTACEKVSIELGIPHFSASKIIGNEKSSALSTNSKLVSDVADNQRLLIQGVSRLLENSSFLLDGHFTMRRKSDEGLESIHPDVFRELRIGGIVLFTDHPEKISKRMHARDGMLYPVDLFRTHQDAETAHANHVANTLGLPIVILQAFDIEGMVRIVEEWNTSNIAGRKTSS